MLSHQEIYQELLKPQHFEQFEQLMKTQNVHTSLNATAASLESKDGFPYVLLKINTEEIFAAQMVGLYLLIQDILPEYSEYFYFPAIAMANGYNPQIAKLINHENSIRHELLHIKDVLALIDKDPTYLERVTQYSLKQLDDEKNLAKSIAIEVFKIFYLEPQAFASDFSHGEKAIRTTFLGQIVEYQCQTKAEYIEMQLSDYLENLSLAYQNKFPQSKKRIEKKIESSVLKYGKEVLGSTPLEKLQQIRQDYPAKMLADMLKITSIKVVDKNS